jgi:hypothetical protein
MSETTASKPSKVKPPKIPRDVNAPKIGHRSSDYTEEAAEEICLRLTHGEPLVQMCKDDHLPHVVTVYRWLLKHESFRNMYTQAREEQADTNADQILQIADEMPPEFTDDKGRTTIDQSYLAWQKQRIEARKWTAAKLKPRKYGEKISVGGDAGNPVQVEAVGEAQNLLEALLLNVELKKQV